MNEKESKINVIEPVYLKLSGKILKVYTGLFLFSLIMSIFIRPLMNSYKGLLDLLVGLPILLVIVMAPMGLLYSLRSMKKREGDSRTRNKYFFGHLFFCLLIILLLVFLMSDVSKLK